MLPAKERPVLAAPVFPSCAESLHQFHAVTQIKPATREQPGAEMAASLSAGITTVHDNQDAQV